MNGFRDIDGNVVIKQSGTALIGCTLNITKKERDSIISGIMTVKLKRYADLDAKFTVKSRNTMVGTVKVVGEDEKTILGSMTVKQMSPKLLGGSLTILKKDIGVSIAGSITSRAVTSKLLQSQLTVRSRNVAVGTVKVVGEDFGYIPDCKLIVRRNDKGVLQTALDIHKKYKEKGIGVSLIVRKGGGKDITFMLAVRPNVRMIGTVHVVPPPFYEMEILPIQDATVKSNTPDLSYGDGITLAVGNYKGGVYRSFLDFDPSSVPAKKDIDKVTVNLTMMSASITPARVGVYLVKEVWSENTVNWINKPTRIYDMIATVPAQANGVVEADITPYFKSTLYEKKDTEKLSICVKLLDETQPALYMFSSKEASFSKPVLHVSYYDMVVNPRDELLAGTLTVAQEGKGVLHSTIEVHSQYPSNYIPGGLEILQKEAEPIVPCSFTISDMTVQQLNAKLQIPKKYAETTLGASTNIYGRLEVPATLDIKLKDKVSSLSGRLTLPIKNKALPVKLVIGMKEGTASLGAITLLPNFTGVQSVLSIDKKYKDTSIGGALYVGDYADLIGNLLINKKEVEKSINSSLNIRGSLDLDSSLSILKKEKFNEIDSSFTIPTSKLLSAKLNVGKKVHLSAKMEVIGASHLNCSFKVISDNINIGLKVAQHTFTLLNSDCVVRVVDTAYLSGSFQHGFGAESIVSAMFSVNVDDGYVFIM